MYMPEIELTVIGPVHLQYTLVGEVSLTGGFCLSRFREGFSLTCGYPHTERRKDGIYV